MTFPRNPAPYATAALAVLVLIALVSWAHRAPSGPDVARVDRTRAKLFDGMCEFSADVELRGRFGTFFFQRDYLQIRDAMIALLRTKSEYMVRTTQAREALRSQMRDTVNRVVGREIAADLRFTRFALL